MDRLKPTNDTHVLNLHVDILQIFCIFGFKTRICSAISLFLNMKSKKKNIEIDVICNILLTTSSEPLKSSTLLVQKRLTLLFFVKMLNSYLCLANFTLEIQ